MSAHVKHDEYEFEDVYTIFVMFDGLSGQCPLMAVRGGGDGYYGTGFTLTVYPTTSEKYGPYAQ